MNATPERAAGYAISRRIVDEYTVHMKMDGSDYLDLYLRLRRNEIPYKVLLHDDDGHFVRLVETDGRAFVFKRVKGQDANLETTLWQLFAGPFYSGLMRRVNRAVARGCRVVPDMYLVAERMIGRLCVDKYLLTEFIPGRSMEKLDDPALHRDAIAAAFSELHRYDLSLGNVKAGNMVWNGSEVKFIDLSTRCTQWTGRAKDVVRLRRTFGVSLPDRGLADRLGRRYVGLLFGFVRVRNRIRVALGLKKE